MKDVELEGIKELIKEAKAKGYRVFSPEKLTSYFWFVSDDEKIGYCQYSRIGGLSFATVHKPCTANGTGFQAKSFEEAFCVVPPVFGPNRRGVVKHKNLEDFKNNHWQFLVER